MTEKILLGFQVPSGEPFYLNLHHLVITGMTELSGKTTAIEALIERSGLRAIVFKTKRGEKGFERVGRSLPLYFKERSDWQYVSSLIEATLREKMKFERSWIIRACKGARTLRDVYAQVKEFLKKERLRALDRSIFTNLQAYLELVLPSIEQLEFTDKLEIGPGVNVMDLEDLYAKPEVQALIIRSVMEYILEYERDIIVVVPECWKFLPQGRGSPVKIFFERFIREGATINNYLWLDSQDIAGVDKTPLRQVDNWILGRQKETHEVDRTIDAIPLPKAEKPKPLEIRRLKVGHFIAACGDTVKLVYVLPAGVPEEVGRKVAVGEMTPEHVRDRYLKVKKEDEDLVYKEKYEALKRTRDERVERYKTEVIQFNETIKDLRKKLADQKSPEEIEELRKTITQLNDQLAKLRTSHENLREWKGKLIRQVGALESENASLKEALESSEKIREVFSELIQGELKRLEWEPYKKGTAGLEPGAPSEIVVVKEQPALAVETLRKPLTLSQADLLGRIAIVYAEELLPPDKAFTVRHLNRIMEQRFGRKEAYANFPKVLTDFVAWGFFEKIRAGNRWDYRLKMKPEEAREKGLLKTVEKVEA